jgi:PAS domain-containing protein
MPNWIDIHQRALRGERFDMREDCWVRADGHREWNQWAIHPWHDGTGKVGGIVMFTEVITARKIAEAALRTSEAVNRAAMDKAPIGKAVVLPNGRFMKVNPAMCQLLGHSEQELMAMDFQALTHPDDVESNLANFHALLAGKAASFPIRETLPASRWPRDLGAAQLVAGATSRWRGGFRRRAGAGHHRAQGVRSHQQRPGHRRDQELREPLTSIREALHGIVQLPEAGCPRP